MPAPLKIREAGFPSKGSGSLCWCAQQAEVWWAWHLCLKLCEGIGMEKNVGDILASGGMFGATAVCVTSKGVEGNSSCNQCVITG